MVASSVTTPLGQTARRDRPASNSPRLFPLSGSHPSHGLWQRMAGRRRTAACSDVGDMAGPRARYARLALARHIGHFFILVHHGSFERSNIELTKTVGKPVKVLNGRNIVGGS